MQNIKDPKFLKLLGKQIRFIRESKGLTQASLGDLCDNHAEQIGRIERGEYNVTICSLRNIADALDISLKDMFDFKY